MIDAAIKAFTGGLSIKTMLIGACILVVLVAGRYYGHVQYQSGVIETTDSFVTADKKGAKDVKSNAKKILKGKSDLSDAAILDLLRRNGGLRADLQ